MINGKYWLRAIGAATFILLAFSTRMQAQSSSEIYHRLLKLKETKRVLYIAAHPDDENTRLIAYLGNKEHAQVAYLSLTRGDGGQNLIGKELGLELGMIRTQELLRARETDGGRQFFTRAIDFGFSKNPSETLNNWDRQKLLSDVVWIIRSFQPDIIINRFNTQPGTTHGHHTTSAILSVEAFKEAGKSTAFPEQLSLVDPWQPKRVFWNGYNWGAKYEPEEGKTFHEFPVGNYNPLLGTTYSQIAADSRTMHKSQGFGSTAQIGNGQDYIELIDGDPFKEDPFEGIPNKWTNLAEGPEIESAITAALENFNFLDVSSNVNALLDIKSKLDALDSAEIWIQEKQQEIEGIILASLGIMAEFLAQKELAYPSEEIATSLVINNPSKLPVEISSFSVLEEKLPIAQKIQGNEAFNLEIPLHLPEDYPISQPYWLKEPPQDNLFTIQPQGAIGQPFNRPSVSGKVLLKVEGQEIDLEIPLKYKYNDQVDGEINQPFTVIPEIRLSVNKENVFVLNDQPDTMEVEVFFEGDMTTGTLVFEGLSTQDYNEVGKIPDAQKKKMTYKIQLNGLSEVGKKEITVKYLTESGKVFDKGMKRISYRHIPNLTYFPSSTFNLINLELKISPQRIGYIPGAGDDIPEVLMNLGYEVSLLENGMLNAERLSQYQTVILGIRALNVNQNLANQMDEVMEYVEGGGNLIVQYNTSSPLLARQLGPYPFELTRNRVAVEDSPVKLEHGSHPILNSPNTIEGADFEGWVQERGLYFPGDWAEQYVTPFTMQDPDEPENKGALLLANYGKGTYTYSGISWFRLLPAGVPGAIKVFVNLIEQADERYKSELE
jgi:LmbE family N-acetylglucosaminyl deacetylase